MRLSRRYGASIYASIRRYVTKNTRACVVLVLEPATACPRRGFVAKFRRDVVSPEFRKSVGVVSWPDEFSPDDQIGAMVPIGGRKMSRPREVVLSGDDGREHRCVAEAFTQGHQVFVLIHSIVSFANGMVVVP